MQLVPDAIRIFVRNMRRRRSQMNLVGKTFRAVSNSVNGSSNTETQMRFTSDGEVVIGNYGGGTIAAGHVLGKRLGESELEMLYQGARMSGEIRAGKARAIFAKDERGQLRMHLDWQWLTGEPSRGESDWILV
jgi:hypothetical protein